MSDNTCTDAEALEYLQGQQKLLDRRLSDLKCRVNETLEELNHLEHNIDLVKGRIKKSEEEGS